MTILLNFILAIFLSIVEAIAVLLRFKKPPKAINNFPNEGSASRKINNSKRVELMKKENLKLYFKSLNETENIR